MQYISYHICCVYLEDNMPRLYSSFLGSNHPTTADSFAWGPVQMDLEYSGNNRKSRLLSFHCVHH